MPTAITPTSAAATQQASFATAQTGTTERKQTLDRDVFLNLLVTQLTNQDPSSPMDTNEMIAQTTQLSMMEALTQIQETTTGALSVAQRQAAIEHLGKTVAYLAADGTTGTGTVTSITSESAGGTSSLVLDGGQTVTLDQITAVTGA